MEKLRVSILIPAYRAETTIAAAIGSLLQQTYPTWDAVIAADDHADYIGVLRRSGIVDTRIRQINTDAIASGPGPARNCALNAAKTRFIANLDADDDYAPDRLQRLLPLAKTYGAVIDNTLVHETDGRLLKCGFAEKPDAETWPVTADDILSPRVPFFPVFDRTLVESSWPAVPFAEDVLFNLHLLSVAPKMQAVGYHGYHYRKRDGSITQSAQTAERAEQSYCAILDLLAADRVIWRPDIRAAAIQEFRNNLTANQEFRRYLAAGRCQTLEQFLLLTDNGRKLSPQPGDNRP